MIDNRYKEEAIATQLTESTIKIALGGGRKFFRIKNTDKLQFYLDFKNSKAAVIPKKKLSVCLQILALIEVMGLHNWQ